MGGKKTGQSFSKKDRKSNSLFYPEIQFSVPTSFLGYIYGHAIGNSPDAMLTLSNGKKKLDFYSYSSNWSSILLGSKIDKFQICFQNISYKKWQIWDFLIPSGGKIQKSLNVKQIIHR